VPITGGLIWMADYKLVFLVAVGLSLASLALAQLVTRQVRASEQG